MIHTLIAQGILPIFRLSVDYKLVLRQESIVDVKYISRLLNSLSPFPPVTVSRICVSRNRHLKCVFIFPKQPPYSFYFNQTSSWGGLRINFRFFTIISLLQTSSSTTTTTMTTSAAKLYGKDLSVYDDLDVDTLLSQLSPEEISLLAKEVDPDVSC